MKNHSDDFESKYAPLPNKDFSNLRSNLIELHGASDLITPFIEDIDREIPVMSLAEDYVKLAISINNKDKSQHIEKDRFFENIRLKDNESVLPASDKILIFGEAGTGKTTYLRHIAYKWAKDGLWANKFKYVFRASLKLLLESDWDNLLLGGDKDIDDYLTKFIYCSMPRSSRKKIDWRDVKQVLDNGRALLLLDGYDEVAHINIRIGKEVLDQALKYEGGIILTSRPHATDKIPASFTRHIENKGFDMAGIEKYIEASFKDHQELGKSLWKLMEADNQLKEICKIPVNISILSYIWQDDEVRSKLQNKISVTFLYDQIVMFLCRKYIARYKKEVKWSEINDITRDQIDEEGYLKKLKELAYDSFKEGEDTGINEGSLIIDSSRLDWDLKQHALIRKELDLGSRNGRDIAKYSFLHLTLQEYLTAAHLYDKLLDPKKIGDAAEFIAPHRRDNRYEKVIKFIAGLTQMRDTEDRASDASDAFWEAMTLNIDGVMEFDGRNYDMSIRQQLIDEAMASSGIVDIGEVFIEVKKHAYNYWLDIAMNDNNSGLVRMDAVRMLQGFKKDSSEVLTALLDIAKNDKDDSDVHMEVVKQLGRFKDFPDAVAALLDIAMNDKNDSDVRMKAASLLKSTDHASDAVAALWDIAQNDNYEWVRKAAVKRLGEFKDFPDVFAALLDIAKNHNDSWVRRRAVKLLGEFKDSFDAVAELRDIAQNDDNGLVRMEAVNMLRGFKDSPDAIPELLSIAKNDKDSWVRRAAVKRLGEFKDSPYVLATLLDIVQKDNDSLVRMKAAILLKSTEYASDAVAALWDIAQNDNGVGVRRDAVKLLGEFKNSPDAVAALLDIAQNDDTWMRSQAVKLLGEFKNSTDAVATLLSIAKNDKDSWVRMEAVGNLETLLVNLIDEGNIDLAK